MGRTLLVGERIGGPDWGVFRSVDARGLAVSFLPPVASDPPPAGMGLRTPPPEPEEGPAAARDAAAFAFAGEWHAEWKDPPFDPRYTAILVFLETVDLLRRLDFLETAVAESRPDELVAGSECPAAARDALAFVGERRGIPVRFRENSRPRASGWRASARAWLGRRRYRRASAEGDGPLLLWSYPKMHGAPLVETLHARGGRFLLHGREEGFWEKGIPYAFLASPSFRATDWGAFLREVPLAVPAGAADAAPLLRRALGRLLPSVFAEMERLAASLARFPARMDAVVAADFVSGAAALACAWGAERGIPVLGVQHGAPAFDHWLKLGHACPGTILAWAGEPSLRPFRAAGIPEGRLARVGCPGHDRWVGRPAREGRGDILLYAAVESPYMSARFGEALTDRMLRDLLSAAAAFPGIEVVLKPHPSQPPADRAFLARLAASVPGVRARVAEGEPVEALLVRSAAVATRLSTMAVEAGLLGIPVVRLDYGLARHPWYTGFLKDPRIRGGASAAELQEALGWALGPGRREAADAARAFASDWDAADGRATERVVERILSEASRR